MLSRSAAGSCPTPRYRGQKINDVGTVETEPISLFINSTLKSWRAHWTRDMCGRTKMWKYFTCREHTHLCLFNTKP